MLVRTWGFVNWGRSVYTPMKRLLRALTVCFLLAFAGCQLADYTIARKSAIDKEIATARAETTAHLTLLNDQQLTLLKQSIAAHEAREQGAADYLVKATITFGTLKTPSRPEMVMGQSIQQTAAQLPPPSVAAQAKAMDALRIELDETRISAEALRAQYEAELGQARAEGATKEKALADLTVSLKKVDDERVAVLTKAKDAEAALSDARNAAANESLAAKQKALDDAKHNEKVKMWLIGTLLTATAACGIGAAFVPIPALKTKLILGAAICGAAAIAIPFIEAWMIMVSIGVCLLGVAAWVINDYRREHGDATDTYRAINEVKQKASAEFKAVVAPILGQWHTDPATTQRIDERLKQTGDV